MRKEEDASRQRTLSLSRRRVLFPQPKEGMVGLTSSEIESSHDERPSVGGPSPAGDRAVDDGGPEEHEHEGGSHSSSLSHSSDGEDGSDAGEHALV